MNFAEGLQNKFAAFGESVTEWVKMDRARGGRFERALRGIEANTYSATEVEYDYITQVMSASTTGAGGILELPVVPQGFVWEYTHLAAFGESGNPSADIFLDNTAFIGSFDTQRVLPLHQPLVLTEGRRLVARIDDADAASKVTICAQLRRIPSRSKRVLKNYADSAPPLTPDRGSKSEVNFGQGAEVVDPRGTEKDATKATPLTTGGRDE